MIINIINTQANYGFAKTVLDRQVGVDVEVMCVGEFVVVDVSVSLERLHKATNGTNDISDYITCRFPTRYAE